jgi:adenylosuccinate synthase
MPVTVIVGGQFGSEGKGKVAFYWAQNNQATVAVRVGGSNSGHTVIDSSGNPQIFQHLPTAALLPHIYCVIPAGSYLTPEILLNEIERANLPPDRLFIDPNAVIITETEKNEEKNSLLRQSIGSTLSGTGAAVYRRIQRIANIRLAKNEESLQSFVRPVVPFMRQRLAQGERVIIEGTQGFGLSLLHSPYYPYVTSRDTTASAFISEAGLSPLDVDQIVLVLRAFPIRVAGNSGILPHEIDWHTITEESGSPDPIEEYTSVTKLTRRVARFEPEIVRQAIMINCPTHIVLNHLDYIDFSRGSNPKSSEKLFNFIGKIEKLVGSKINYYGLNPLTLEKRI